MAMHVKPAFQGGSSAVGITSILFSAKGRGKGHPRRQEAAPSGEYLKRDREGSNPSPSSMEFAANLLPFIRAGARPAAGQLGELEATACDDAHELVREFWRLAEPGRRIRHGAPQDTADFAAPRLDLVLVMTRPANSPAMLTELLDALEAELLAAPASEVQFSLRLTGRARSAASQEVRSLLDEAKAATEEGFARTGPQDRRDEAIRLDLGLYRH